MVGGTIAEGQCVVIVGVQGDIRSEDNGGVDSLTFEHVLNNASLCLLFL